MSKQDNELDPLPSIKVCGVTRVEDLKHLAEQGVNAVGINLVPRSKRRVDLNHAITLARHAREHFQLRIVAVVMDPDPESLRTIARAFPWDYLQLHGEETPESAEDCNGIAIIKAVPWSGLEEQVKLASKWSESTAAASKLIGASRSRLAGFLLDAFAPGEGGGTGKKARWDLIWPRHSILEHWPLMLAGGLTPDNVAEAIQSTRVHSVDVASGVESSPGVKDCELVQQFVQNAKLGFKLL